MTETYKLTQERHEVIYKEKIASRYLPKSKAQEKPCAIITGGQPGCGKSKITEIAITQFQGSGYVLVDADKLRPYHPAYNKLLRENDKLAANLTHPDCGTWATRLLYDGVAGRRNIIIDQTSRDPAAMTQMTQTLRQAGYRVELRVMAVSRAVSEQRIYQRYEGQRAKDGFGRFSTKEKHHEAYAGVEKTIASVEANKQVDRICLYDRNLNRIYDNALEKGQWQKEPEAEKTIRAERLRPMTLDELREHMHNYDKLVELINKPERQASKEEIQHIYDLRLLARMALERELTQQGLSREEVNTIPDYGHIKQHEHDHDHNHDLDFGMH